ncbi:hypothetical protein ACFLZL_05585, partial [Thermodesulfobacteriota bacterium]
LFPERHWNPYIPFTVNSSLCGSCPNRITRVKKQHEICLEFFKQAKNKRKVFQDMADLIVTHGGLTKGKLVLFREIFSDKLVLLGAGGDMRRGHDVLKGERWQGLIDAVKERGTFSVPHFPHDIPNGTNPSSLMLYREDPKSYYRFSSGRHLVMFIMGTDVTMIFTPDVLKVLQKFIDKLDEIWHKTYPD